MHEDEDDAALVTRAAGGSEPAFRALYRRHARAVYWIAHGLLGTRPDAEDAVQETFVVAWRKLGGLALAGDSLLPWLAAICRHTAANRIRSRRRERAHVAPAEHAEHLAAATDVERQVVAAATLDAVLRELAGMSGVDREILRLCVAEGLPYAEAAERIGVGHGAVRNRLARIRSRLRIVAGEEMS
jgi:RNA polymerase sigma-70 factor (ECF subfamily)